MMNYLGKKTVQTFILIYLFFVSSAQAADALLTWVSLPEQGVSQVNMQRLINDEWQAVEEIYRSNDRVFSPAVSSNKNGDILVVWTSTSTIRSVVKAAFNIDGVWQTPLIIANQGGLVTTPVVVFDHNNNAFIAWATDHNGRDDVYWQQWFAKTEEWSAAERANQENSVPDFLPSLTLNQNGDVLLEWQFFDRSSAAAITLSRVFEIEHSENIPLQQNEKLKELSFADVTLPDDWAGASGRAVMHFPNNSSVMYEKLPRYVSQP